MLERLYISSGSLFKQLWYGGGCCSNDRGTNQGYGWRQLMTIWWWWWYGDYMIIWYKDENYRILKIWHGVDGHSNDGDSNKCRWDYRNNFCCFWRLWVLYKVPQCLMIIFLIRVMLVMIIIIRNRDLWVVSPFGRLQNPIVLFLDALAYIEEPFVTDWLTDWPMVSQTALSVQSLWSDSHFIQSDIWYEIWPKSIFKIQSDRRSDIQIQHLSNVSDTIKSFL